MLLLLLLLPEPADAVRALSAAARNICCLARGPWWQSGTPASAGGGNELKLRARRPLNASSFGSSGPVTTCVTEKSHPENQDRRVPEDRALRHRRSSRLLPSS